jgi:hypothetical protein
MFMEPVTRLGAKCDVFGREVQVQPGPRGIFQPSGAYSSFKKMTIRHLYYDGRGSWKIAWTKYGFGAMVFYRTDEVYVILAMTIGGADAGTDG